MAGYQEIFGGSAVYPSNQTYTQIALTSNIQLAWPIESVSTNIIVADLMDITPGVPGGWNVTLPDATGGSTGITMIFNNKSTLYDFNVLDNGGGAVLNAPPGTVWLIYLTDNSTGAGIWSTFQYGAQSGSVNVAAIAGAGLVAIGSSLNQSMPVNAKSTNYTAVVDDRASVVLWTGGSGTLSLPAPSVVANNWFINVANKGSGDLTVTPAAGLIDGTASKIFTAGLGTAIVFTDGANYYTLGYGFGSGGGGSGFNYTTIDATGSDGVNGVISLSPSQQNKISYMVFGALTGTRTIVVPSSVQEYWINNQTSGAFTLTIKASTGTGLTVPQLGQAIMYFDGTNMQPAVSGITLPVPVSSGGTGATTAGAALTSLGGTATGVALFTASSAHQARLALQAGATGEAVFQAATPSAALTAMATGTMTGAMGVTGVLTAGGIRVTDVANPIDGIYLPSAHHLAFATSNILAGYFGSDQHLNLTWPLDVSQGGTGVTTTSAVNLAFGEPTMIVNTLVARNSAGNILANFFNAAGATENVSLGAVWTERSPIDGYNRRMLIADFVARLNPLLNAGNFVAASSGYQVFGSGIMIQWGPTGDIAPGALGQTVNFGTAFPTANWVVLFQENQDHLAGSTQAASHVQLLNRTQFKVINNSNGTQAFYYFAIGN